MYRSAFKIVKNPDLIEGYAPPLFMRYVIGKGLYTGHMQPVQFARNPHACFIKMYDGRRYDLFLDPLITTNISKN